MSTPRRDEIAARLVAAVTKSCETVEVRDGLTLARFNPERATEAMIDQVSDILVEFDARIAALESSAICKGQPGERGLGGVILTDEPPRATGGDGK